MVDLASWFDYVENEIFDLKYKEQDAPEM